MHQFQKFLCHESLHVSDSSSVHHQEFIHCTLSNGICHTAFEQEHMLLHESCLQTCMTYTTAECTVKKLLMMDRRTVRNMERFMTKQICEIGESSWFYYKETNINISCVSQLARLRRHMQRGISLWRNQRTTFIFLMSTNDNAVPW